MRVTRVAIIEGGGNKTVQTPGGKSAKILDIVRDTATSQNGLCSVKLVSREDVYETRKRGVDHFRS